MMHSPSHWVAMGIVSQPPEGEETGFFFFLLTFIFRFSKDRSLLLLRVENMQNHKGARRNPQ